MCKIRQALLALTCLPIASYLKITRTVLNEITFKSRNQSRHSRLSLSKNLLICSQVVITVPCDKPVAINPHTPTLFP